MSNFQTSPQRHANMAAIHGKDTKPEMVVRCYLWGHGFRYRLNHPRLPGNPSYHFYVQDHQGNNRLVLSASGGVEEVNSYYPYGGLMSMSTASTQRFKYNGKELNQHSYMMWYDYGAKQFVGSYTFDSYTSKDKTHLLNIIYDTKNIRSLLYHTPGTIFKPFKK